MVNEEITSRGRKGYHTVKLILLESKAPKWAKVCRVMMVNIMITRLCYHVLHCTCKKKNGIFTHT